MAILLFATLTEHALWIYLVVLFINFGLGIFLGVRVKHARALTCTGGGYPGGW